MYDRYFRAGVCVYGGRVPRFPMFKDRRLESPSVVKWKAESGAKWENKFRMCVPNIEAGYLSGCKYERPQPVLAENPWKLSGEWTARHFAPHMSGSSVLSEFDAVKEAERGPSPGYPFNLHWKDKGAFFDDPEGQPMLGEYWERLATSEPAPIFWQLSVKYELRAVEKLAANKLRTFTASSVVHSIANSRLCFHMNEKFYRSHLRTWSFVGCSKFRLGFNRAMNKLRAHKNGWTLDEKTYDCSVFARMLAEICEFRISCLAREARTEENTIRMRNLYIDIIHSLMVGDSGDVIVKNTGNPSGQGNTIVDNTLALFRLTCYAWIVLWLERADHRDEDISYTVMMANVSALLCGDDNTLAVSESVAGWFNAVNIARVWSSIGVETDTECWEARPVEHLDFLSNRWVKDEKTDYYLPCPDESRVLDSLLYGSSSHDVRWSLLRAYALRIDSWANVSCREKIASYIEFVWQNYQDELAGSLRVPTTTNQVITYDEIKAVWMTDSQLHRLYIGFEQCAMSVKHTEGCFKILRILSSALAL